MNSIPRKALLSLVGLGLLFLSIASLAQVRTDVASVPLSYNGPESLYLSASASTGTIAFPMGGGTAPGTISINTEYSLNPGRILTVEAGFNNPWALADGNGNFIPAFAVSGIFSSSDGGSVMARPDCEGPPSGQTQIAEFSCGWVTYDPVPPFQTSGTHNDTLSLSLAPWFAAPGNYTGLLYISAQAN